MLKTADMFDDVAVPSGNALTGGGSFSGPPAPAAGYSVSSPIIEMQTAMKKLSQDIMLGTHVTSPNPQQAETPKGTFNDFLAGHYSENGGQLTEALKQLSGGQKDFAVDGKWGPQTEGGLYKIADFTDALVKLATEFKIPTDELSNPLAAQYLREKTLEDIKKMTNTERNKRAKEIIPHLEAINKLYNQIMTQITKNPFNMKKMEEKVQMNTFTPAEEKLMQSDAKVSGVSYPAPKLPEQKLDYIPLKALTSKEEYFKHMANIGASEQDAINIFNNEIKPKIEAF